MSGSRSEETQENSQELCIGTLPDEEFRRCSVRVRAGAWKP